MKKWFRAFALLLTVFPAIFSTAASADTMTWKIQSFSRYPVEVAFFSQNRKNVWPSTTTVWTIKNYDVASYKLSCVRGEQICYGAKVKGASTTYWGRGTNGKQACKGCCFTCGGDTVTQLMKLNE